MLFRSGCVAYGGKGFTNLQTFLNILISNAGLICVACGMTCVMLTGGIDISVGSLVALDCMLLAYGMGEWHQDIVRLGADGLRDIWREAKLRGRGYSRADQIVRYARESVGLKHGTAGGRKAVSGQSHS